MTKKAIGVAMAALWTFYASMIRYPSLRFDSILARMGSGKSLTTRSQRIPLKSISARLMSGPLIHWPRIRIRFLRRHKTASLRSGVRSRGIALPSRKTVLPLILSLIFGLETGEQREGLAWLSLLAVAARRLVTA